jgi:hypothetical protein
MATNQVPELIASSDIRFVVGTSGEPTGVLVDISTWQRIIRALEDAEDLAIARQALNQIDAAGGDLEKAGFLPWEQLRAEANHLST